MEKWLVEILNSFKKEIINSDSNLFLIKGKTGTGKTIFGVDLGMNLRGNKKVLIVNHLLSDLGMKKEEAILRQFFLSFDKISAVNKFESEKINTDEVGVLIFDNLECLEFQEFLDLIKISQSLKLKAIFISETKNVLKYIIPFGLFFVLFHNDYSDLNQPEKLFIIQASISLETSKF